MTRIRTIAALAAVLALALPSAALAAIHVNGGTTQLTLTSAASNALSANHMTVTPITPATASGATFTFPISHGKIRKHNLHGTIFHAGGFTLSNGTRAVQVRHLVLISGRDGVSLFAFVGKAQFKAGHVVRSLHRVARVSAIHRNSTTATGVVRLTAYTARGINSLAGKRIARAGTVLGTIAVTPTFG